MVEFSHAKIEALLQRLCDEGKMTVSHADEVVSAIFNAAHGLEEKQLEGKNEDH